MIGRLVDVVHYDTAATALAGDVPAGVSVLPVIDGADFGPVGGRLLLDETTTLAYTAADTATITLAAPLPVAALDAASVRKLDVRGQPLVEALAMLLFDDDARAQPAVIPSNLAAYFPVGTDLAGSLVEAELHNGLWRVTSQPDQVPVFDSDYIATPKATGLLRVDTPLASSVAFTTITDFTVLDSYGVAYESATGIWRFTIRGEWFIKFDFGYAANTSGIRTGYVMIHNIDGTTETGSLVKAEPVENAATAQQVIEDRLFEVGQGVSFLTKQTSGATLDLLGSNGNTARRPTAVKFRRGSAT